MNLYIFHVHLHDLNTIVTLHEPSLKLQKQVAPPPGTVKFQEPNLKVQRPLAPPQIGALSNDVLQ